MVVYVDYKATYLDNILHEGFQRPISKGFERVEDWDIQW
jgi:hypothetical protein